MADPRELADDFARRFEAGERPDPSEWLGRVDGEERQELELLIDRYLMSAPRRTWDPVAYESSPAKQAVDRVFDSLEGVSGTWPELLPRLRKAAEVKRGDLVRRLAEALGVGAGEEQVEKVGRYYHEMEHGLLPANGVSARVIDALGGIVGASSETIRAAGLRRVGSGGIGGEAAFARLTAPDSGGGPPFDSPGLELADAEMDAAAPERDEIDRLFTEG